jgi:5-hydroxyisourate hydrolase
MITTHVLDLAHGRPAAGLGVRLERRDDGGWTTLAERVTDDDGRVRDLTAAGDVRAGTHRLTFAAGAWFEARGIASFHPEIAVTFDVRDPMQHHHVPLLLSAHGYSTYRGS